MSFSTSSSSARRNRLARYTVLAAVILAGGLAAFAVLAVYLQPLEGDLTRVGWYSEREFGWNVPQRRLLAQQTRFHDDGRPFDVIVIGDSFSTSRGTEAELLRPSWHQLIAALTGWSVLVLQLDDVDMMQLAHETWFKRTTPRLVIYQVVERYLPKYPWGVPCELSVAASTVPHIDVDLHNGGVATTLRYRPEPLDQINPGYARAFLWVNLLRDAFGYDPSYARAIELKEAAPFSSRDRDTLLIYEDDLKKAAWPRNAIEEFRCRIATLAQHVEANGKTRFIALVAPDKLSVYSGFVADDVNAHLSRLHELRVSAGNHIVDVFTPLQQAVARGEIDIYLPDDTHWGFAGHEIVATTVLEHLATGAPQQ